MGKSWKELTEEVKTLKEENKALQLEIDEYQDIQEKIAEALGYEPDEDEDEEDEEDDE